MTGKRWKQKQPWKPREPNVTRSKPPEGRPLFKPGDRVRFRYGVNRGQELIVVGQRPRHDNFFMVTRNLEDPHAQCDWFGVRANQIEFPSAIDQLGSLMLDEHGKIQEDEP